MSPEAINLQREEQDPPEYTDNTKTDVWNFGILVHNVVAPLSLVEIRSTSSLRISSRLCTSTWTPSPPPKAAIVEQQAPEFSLLTILRGLTAKTANRSSSGSSGTTISSPTWTPGPDDSGQSTYSIGSKARRRHVERHLVGYALASGTYVVDFPPTRRKSKRPRRDPSSSFPQWARQLVTLCLAAEPLRRPSMNDLLIVLSYFED
ncbi:hypothetical protein Pelo_18798 [Pelomyxa schiedti]|nr:hypothetical protein Pelo_18798 [Pelomyxa schiedti]